MAGGLQELQNEFIAETGLDFSFLFVLSQDSNGNTADVEDVVSYHTMMNEPSFPVLADGARQLAVITPMGEGQPEMCALSPQMEIIRCYFESGGHEQALLDIRAHAGI